jgi:hypothetical protein
MGSAVTWIPVGEEGSLVLIGGTDEEEDRVISGKPEKESIESKPLILGLDKESRRQRSMGSRYTTSQFSNGTLL